MTKRDFRGKAPTTRVLLTVKRVAELDNCSEKTVRRAIEAGLLEAIRVGAGGRMLRIDPAAHAAASARDAGGYAVDSSQLVTTCSGIPCPPKLRIFCDWVPPNRALWPTLSTRVHLRPTESQHDAPSSRP